MMSSRVIQWILCWVAASYEDVDQFVVGVDSLGEVFVAEVDDLGIEEKSLYLRKLTVDNIKYKDRKRIKKKIYFEPFNSSTKNT